MMHNYNSPFLAKFYEQLLTERYAVATTISIGLNYSSATTSYIIHRP